MRIRAWRVPPLDNGTYLVVDDHGEALAIDPSMGERQLLAAVKEEGLRLQAILNSHGHPDHVYGNKAVKEGTRARLAIHSADAYRLASSRSQLGFEVPLCQPDDLLEEGPVGYVTDVEIMALHTPGHTEGSTCFYLPGEGTLFSGDVLFAGNIGRVDLPGGDQDAMERSLGRLAALPAETLVYPGHGPPTTIGDELSWLHGFRFS